MEELSNFFEVTRGSHSAIEAKGVEEVAALKKPQLGEVWDYLDTNQRGTFQSAIALFIKGPSCESGFSSY